jgi:hypothetical protein
MNRIVQPELLDSLPPDDPAAIHSRHDLQRINALMRHPHFMTWVLSRYLNSSSRLTEIGAGDGKFLIDVAQRLAKKHPNVEVTLLDRQASVSTNILEEFERLGWKTQSVVSDVFDWDFADGEVIVANLFLHHFEEVWLAQLLQKISMRAKLFVAVEPRRARWPWFCSHLLGAIGCNAVTRHDAVVSVRAGFSGNEISALWPDKEAWQLTERSAGLFSHLFIAQKIS